MSARRLWEIIDAIIWFIEKSRIAIRAFLDLVDTIKGEPDDDESNERKGK